MCAEGKSPVFSEFLDPARRQYIANVLLPLEKYGIMMAEGGGYEYAERKILGFSFDPLSAEDFPIAKIKLEYDDKYGALAHSDILGAVLGLGLDRSVIGDIVLLPQGAVVLADGHIGEFIASNLFKVGRVGVAAAILSPDAEFFALDNRVPDRLICASMRLDGVLAAAFGLSRNETANMVKSGKAYLNWHEEGSVAKLVKPGDMLTLRRFGRVQIVDVAGKSKKDRFLIDIVRF
ncbi:MAG: YlmH/Sll1252 family protein [Defluviitaleaceae bacterium]|nr:YlmH/Sll1252 family protein [Defluviitaleaceae bacterium]